MRHPVPCNVYVEWKGADSRTGMGWDHGNTSRFLKNTTRSVTSNPMRDQSRG